MARANVSPNSTYGQPSRMPAGGPISGHQHRRALLGTLAAAGTIAAVSAPTGARDTGDHPHVAWLAEYRALDAYWNDCANSRDMEAGDPVAARYWELQGLLIDTQATTIAGMMAQATTAMMFAEGESEASRLTHEYRALANIRTSLATLAGRA